MSYVFLVIVLTRLLFGAYLHCLSSHAVWAITFIPACVCLASNPTFSFLIHLIRRWHVGECLLSAWKMRAAVSDLSCLRYQLPPPPSPDPWAGLPAWLLMHRCVRGWGVAEVCIFLPTPWQRDMKIYLFLWRKRRPFVGRMGTINSIQTSSFTGLPPDKLGALNQYCCRQFFFSARPSTWPLLKPVIHFIHCFFCRPTEGRGRRSFGYAAATLTRAYLLVQLWAWWEEHNNRKQLDRRALFLVMLKESATLKGRGEEWRIRATAESATLYGFPFLASTEVPIPYPLSL